MEKKSVFHVFYERVWRRGPDTCTEADIDLAVRKGYLTPTEGAEIKAIPR